MDFTQDIREEVDRLIQLGLITREYSKDFIHLYQYKSTSPEEIVRRKNAKQRS